jgi:hypothetical protein
MPRLQGTWLVNVLRSGDVRLSIQATRDGARRWAAEPWGRWSAVRQRLWSLQLPSVTAGTGVAVRRAQW